MIDASALALMAQHAALTPHHLDMINRVAAPNTHQYPAPLGETVIPIWEVAMLKQVKRVGRLANIFIDTLEDLCNLFTS